ncbi:hypothetical protein [Larkinella rosea]|uniref:STAS/SEC14 domain-containing protein n=1 Tax=Larkinella rosea TaxID=2025312 RepID=A0A3P1C1V2_9BACT|nr:hypothetical protein [Larkinella rosea]RRB07043.1 hypothetical protein EHT25_04480 [Larkinella rosea]
MNELTSIKNEEGEVYAIMSYEPSRNYLLMKWIGFCTDDELITATLKMLEWQQSEGWRHVCQFHVHDTKEFDVAWAGAVDWIVNEYFPQLHRAGVRYNISILSPDLFSKLSSEALFEKSEPVLPTKLCETLSEAERFIDEHRQVSD